MAFCCGSVGAFIVRIVVGCVCIAFGVVGLFNTAGAQPYYPPPPPDYYGPPPGMDPYGPPPRRFYPAPPPAYVTAPVPPVDVGAPAMERGYGPASEQSAVMPPTYQSAARPSYAQPADSSDVPRPPAAVGAGGMDVTGSIHGAPASLSEPNRAAALASLPPEDQPAAGAAAELSPAFRRQLVDYTTTEPAGTIIIDTPHTFLYLVLGHGKALRYGVGVGREGFTWSGTERITHMSQWPDWHPPKEMIERQPYLPRFMAGGEGNPLGARALYLGNTVYRIHGTNDPSTIGHFVSSGCIRLTNEDIEDLYSRVNVGTRVVVLPGSPTVSASAQGPVAPQGPITR